MLIDVIPNHEAQDYSRRVDMPLKPINIWAIKNGGALGVMVIVVGNGHGDTSSNPARDWLHFHMALIPFGKVWIQLFPSSYG